MAYGYDELTCSILDCRTKVFNKGRMLCAKHYYRLLRHGDVSKNLRKEMAENWEERFWLYVEKSSNESECYNWIGAIDAYGYGVFRVQIPRRMNKKVHRISWELEHGCIPSNMTIDHMCNNTKCVNVMHLQVVSFSENSILAAQRRKAIRESSI